MGNTEPKTQKTHQEVGEFLDSIDDQQQKADCKVIYEMMKKATADSGTMWGGYIVGFGSYTYRYASGREGEWPKIGFSPRKGKTTIYLMDGFAAYKKLLALLGPHSLGKSCLYIKRLADVDQKVLKEIITKSYTKGVPFGQIQ